VKSVLAVLAAAALLFIAGCGGGGGNVRTFGEISGIVFDEEGNPVRDANVYVDRSGQETRRVRSNSNGSYVLTDVAEGDVIVRVEAFQGNVRYFGSNVARVFRGERTMNHNLTVYREDRLGTLEGFVFDRNGYALSGARVFAKQSGGGTTFTSSYGISDREGRYRITALRSGLTYDVQANALDYASDWDQFMLNPGQTRRMDFTLPVTGQITLNPPQNVFATAWTSPMPTRDAAFADAKENMKRIVLPKYKPQAVTRVTTGGNLIEVNVLWDPFFHSNLLGFGLYRAEGSGQLRDIYFLRDPLAELFADTDHDLREGRTYTYRVSTLSTSYDPDRNQGESALSNAAYATPLGDLRLNTPISDDRPTFRWQQAFGADGYVVYLFDRYPSVGVNPLWNNNDNPAFGTQFTYDGPRLAAGRQYWYIVMGYSEAGHYTMSPVDTFTVR
jgi:hypothetical protein